MSASAAAQVLGAPGYTFYLPSGVQVAGTAFYLSAFTASSPTLNFLVGPATIQGSAEIVFPLQSNQAIVFQSGQTYEFVLFGVPGTSPTAEPSSSPSSLFDEFPVGAGVNGIVAGPDGNLWIAMFPLTGSETFSGIGQLTTTGVLQTHSLGSNIPYRIISGPLGELWFTYNSDIGLASMTTSGTLQQFPLPTNPPFGTLVTPGPSNDLLALAEGSDGNVWAVADDVQQIVQFNVMTGVATPFSTVATGSATAPPGQIPWGITNGGDGALWFSQYPQLQSEVGQSSAIGRMSTGGAVTYYSTTGTMANGLASAITFNSIDGNVWFTDNENVGKVTPGGNVTEYPVPVGAGAGYGITAAPDGSLWFIEWNVNSIGHMDANGNFLGDYLIPTANAGPVGITIGPDRNIWFAEQSGQKVGVLNVAAAESAAAKRKR
jgi:streptogramin lyase